jgi:hypothetical protein
MWFPLLDNIKAKILSMVVFCKPLCLKKLADSGVKEKDNKFW